MRIALEQCLVIERRGVIAAQIPGIVRMTQRRDDRIHFDDGSTAGLGVGPPEQAIQTCTADVCNLLGVIQADGIAVIDPFERHARDVGTQNFLRQAVHVFTSTQAEGLPGLALRRIRPRVRYARHVQ